MIRTYNLLKRKPSLYCPHRNVFVAVIRFSFFFFRGTFAFNSSYSDRCTCVSRRVSTYLLKSDSISCDTQIHFIWYWCCWCCCFCTLNHAYIWIEPSSHQAQALQTTMCVHVKIMRAREREILFCMLLLFLFFSFHFVENMCNFSFGIWTWLCSRCSSFVCCVYFYSYSPL